MTAVYPDLAGRVAVVTGGSGSIGSATCRYLEANGMRVVPVGRAVADCTDPDALAALAHDVGGTDVLAAFAGGAGAPVPSLDLTPERWHEVLDTDLTSAFLTVRAFLPGMVDRGRGSIILMSSVGGRQPSRANLAYAVAKAGVIMLTRHLAAEFAGTGVRVNCLAPSAVHNAKMDRAMTPEQIAALGRSFPLGRIGEPDDVAAAVAYLASDASSWITGVTIDISGGKVV